MEKQQIFLFLCKKFEKIPFRIYYFQNLNKHAQLIYSSGEMNKFTLPALSAPREKKYLIQSDSEKMLITFFYSGNTQILFFLANPNLALSEEDLESMHIIFSVLRIENKMKTKEAELASMIDSIRLITSILELEEVLNNIITQALSVISAADAGHLQLYDEKTKELIPRAAVGFNEKIQWIRIKSGESFTGKVYRDSTPVIYYSRSEVYDNMTNISSENSGYIQDSIDSSKLKSLISVPLLLENKVIGVMTVLQYDSEGQLSENDLNLLHGFAAQAAIAIYNAELYQNATERLEEIAKIKSRLEEKNKLLLRRAEIHETLIMLSLQNRDLEFIIQEVKRMMKRDIFFFNNIDTELFPRKTIRYPNLSTEKLSQILKIKKIPFYIDIYDQNQIKYYIHPILSDHVSLGCFILPLIKPILPEDKMTIEQASSVIALELTKRKTKEEVYYKKTQELFNHILQYKEPNLLEEVGESLGLNKNSYFSVLLLKIVPYDDLQTLEAVMHQLIAKIKHLIPRKGRLIFGFHNRVTILFETRKSNEIDEEIFLLNSLLLKWVDQEEMPLYAGLSTPYHGIHSVSKCYDEANKSLSYLINIKKTGIINYKKLGINRLFLKQHSSEIESFTDDILFPLFSEKAESNDLKNTLFTYIKLNKSINDTAEKLHIHKNTLYHRLKKIEELLELELNNSDDFLQIMLAYHLHENFAKH